MAFSSFSEFIAMGGYGFYVWLAYAVSLLSVVLLIVNTIKQRKKILTQIQLRLLREQRIKSAQNRKDTL